MVHPEWAMRVPAGCGLAVLSGVLDFLTVPAIRRLVLDCLGEAAEELVVDLTAVALLSAAAVGALVRARLVALEAGCELPLRVRRGSLAHRVVKVTLVPDWPIDLVS